MVLSNVELQFLTNSEFVAAHGTVELADAVHPSRSLLLQPVNPCLDLILIEVVNGCEMVTQGDKGPILLGANFALELTRGGIMTLGVGIQARELDKALSAHFADEGFLLVVRQNVAVEVRDVGKSASARFADVVLLSGVEQGVLV